MNSQKIMNAINFNNHESLVNVKINNSVRENVFAFILEDDDMANLEQFVNEIFEALRNTGFEYEHIDCYYRDNNELVAIFEIYNKEMKMVDIDIVFDKIVKQGIKLGYNAEEAGEDKIELCFTDEDNDRLGLLELLLKSIALGRSLYKSKYKVNREIKYNMSKE